MNPPILENSKLLHLKSCDHRGFLVPIEMAPGPRQIQGPEGQPVVVMIWSTLAVSCLNCGHVIRFPGMVAVPPQGPQIAPEEPSNGG